MLDPMQMGREVEKASRLGWQHANDLFDYIEASARLREMLLAPDYYVREVQKRKFLRLVRRAFKEIPFYQQRWEEAGVSVSDIKSIDDIGLLPIISKEDLRLGHRKGLFPNSHGENGSMVLRTTGSTGEPLDIAWDRRSAGRMMAYFSRGYIGAHLKERLHKGLFIVVMGHGDTMPPVSLDDPNRNPPDHKMVRGQYAFMDALAPIEEIISFLNEWRPDYVGGYSSTFVSMAMRARAEGKQLWRPKAIILSGEPLTKVSQDLLASEFGAELAMAYIATETGPLAVEYPIGKGYRVFAYDIVLELVDDNGAMSRPGQTGSVIITTLNRRTMPLIRYSGLADLAVSNEKGPSLLRFDSLQGRKVDELRRRGAEPVTPFAVDALMDLVPGIGQYQIVQRSVDEIEILYVPLPESDGGGLDWERATAALKGVFGPQLKVTYRSVPAIPKKRQGVKTPLIVSEIKST